MKSMSIALKRKNKDWGLGMGHGAWGVGHGGIGRKRAGEAGEAEEAGEAIKKFFLPPRTEASSAPSALFNS